MTPKEFISKDFELEENISVVNDWCLECEFVKDCRCQCDDDGDYEKQLELAAERKMDARFERYGDEW